MNAPWTAGGFAIFGGAAGTVTVDNSLGAVTSSGMQFAVDGYLINGGPLALVGPQTTIRVGDGTGAGIAKGSGDGQKGAVSTAGGLPSGGP